MNEPNCKICVHNKNGWCNKYNLQKPKAVIECMAAMEVEQALDYENNNTFSLNDEEKRLLAHAFKFVNKYYYDAKIDEFDTLIQNESSEQGLHNLNIVDSEIELLDKCILEQEKFNKLYKKIIQ